jgi:hypothetical protein
MRRISDSQQRLMVAAAFMLEFYKVVMGTMLTVFVPQRCDPAEQGTTSDVCSIGQVAAQLVHDEDWTQRAAFFMNAATLVIVVVLYGFEAYREDWCITNLDIDPSKPDTQLDAELEAYPELRQTSRRLNERYSRMSGVVAAAVAGNFSLSGVYLLQYQAGMSTLISLVSYLLLLAMKLAQTYRIAHATLKDCKAYSAFMVTQRTFNCVDEDVVAARSSFAPLGAPTSAKQIEIALESKKG